MNEEIPNYHCLPDSAKELFKNLAELEQPLLTTTLDIALIRWSVVCEKWRELSNDIPILGVFLAGWFWRDMGNALLDAQTIGQFKDSFRVGWRECDTQIQIKNK